MNEKLWNWAAVPGSWKGWYEIYLNGYCLGQIPSYCAEAALKEAMQRAGVTL